MVSRKVLFLVGLLVMVAAVISACGPGGNSGNPPPGQTTINVEGSEFQYTPADISVKAGEQVKINFKNTGTVEHTYVIKDLKPELKLVAQPGQTVSKVFTAPSTPGTFDIHCDVAGHTEAGMQGKLTVTAATTN